MAVLLGEIDMQKRSADHKRTPPKKSNSAQSPQSSGDDADKAMLGRTIHSLKIQLNQLVSEKGLADDSVLKHSQLLDQYIVKYQRLLLK